MRFSKLFFYLRYVQASLAKLATPKLVAVPNKVAARKLAWALLLIPAFVGCGEAKVPVVPVTGKVTFGKEIPVGAQIVLHAQGHSLPDDVAPTGRVKEDGTFAISIYGTDEGVPAGEYVATIQWYKIVKDRSGDSISGPNVIPKKYSSPETSPLKITVNNEPTTLPPIEIPTA